MTGSDQVRLYILSDAPPGDPLDCVAAATPLLAPHFAAIHPVGPGQSLSVRALRRAYEPGVDRMLYDFTAPCDHSWAFDLLNAAPAAILLGCYSLTQGDEMADLRSARRYAADGFRFSTAVSVGVLDATASPITVRSLKRPAVTIPVSTEMSDLILAVTPGAIETAYAALLGLKDYADPLVILAATRRDANDLTDIIAAFGMPTAHVRYTRDRAGLVSAMTGACGLIDVDDSASQMVSDAAFVAANLGAPVLRLASPGDAARAAHAFATVNPRRDLPSAADFAAVRSLAGFAGDLRMLIQAGFAHAAKQAAAA